MSPPYVEQSDRGRPAKNRPRSSRNRVLPARIAPGPRAAATSTAAAPAAETAAAPLGLRPGFIDVQAATVQIGAVESRYRFIGLARIGHFDESKAAGTACVAIGYQVHTFHVSVRLEQRPYGGLGGGKIKVSYENIFQRSFSFCLSNLRA